ncbi:MAG TPA: hypothetical protein VF419_02050, partial [Nitrososphaeraceae archaeon]
MTDLQMLIRQPSVSAKKIGIFECANLVKKVMEKAGIRTELLYLHKKNIDYKNNFLENESQIDHFNDIPPLIYGEVKSEK